MTKKQAQRRRQIESAALELLAVKGYRKTSMLQIAKRASASNQTLYAWYGNKQALFKDIIDLNGRAVRGFLKHALKEHEDPLQVLKSLGIHLLRFTTDSKAITMNRAAIIDATETSVLAEAIDSVGRNEVFALICSLMDDLAKRGHFWTGSGCRGRGEQLYQPVVWRSSNAPGSGCYVALDRGRNPKTGSAGI